MRPLGKNILIEPRKPSERTDSGLFIPQTADQYDAGRGRSAPWDGVVMAVGKDNPEPEVVRGSRVLVNRYMVTIIERDGKTLWLAKPGDVVALIQE